MLKLRTFAYQKTQPRERKGKPQSGESSWHHILLKRDKEEREAGRKGLHLKSIKNSYKPVRKNLDNPMRIHEELWKLPTRQPASDPDELSSLQAILQKCR